MRAVRINTMASNMSTLIKDNGDSQYVYMDSERTHTPHIANKDDHNQIVAEFNMDDKKGYEVVHVLNNHKVLVDEVTLLYDELLKMQDLIPVDRIQHDDPNKDDVLFKLSMKISDLCYGNRTVK